MIRYRTLSDNKKSESNNVSESRTTSSNIPGGGICKFFRVPEQEKETGEYCIAKLCRIFSESVGVPTKPEDIEVAHRAGQRSSTKPRPILVRFFNRQKRRSWSTAENSKVRGSASARTSPSEIINCWPLLCNILWHWQSGAGTAKSSPKYILVKRWTSTFIQI